ncbi:adhesion G protein-coupled receptor E3-like isoform X2 [Salminus brasiliensis]|uniref:adhesion G protein-coupled receptor E3-like isoform X2 n=1 Tax=Salminus brasiliensis TaxID=930266 RepID=UPI003B82FE8A
MSSYLPVVAVFLFAIGTMGVLVSKPYYGVTTKGVPCVFPFYFNGYFYTCCVYSNASCTWCSTTDNYTRDGQRGECLNYDPSSSMKSSSSECDSGISMRDEVWPTEHSVRLELVLETEECKDSLTSPSCAEEVFKNLQNIKVQELPRESVEKYLEWIQNYTNTLEGLTDDNPAHGNAVLNAVEKLASTLVRKTDTFNTTRIDLQTLDVQVLVVGPNANFSNITQLGSESATMDIDLIGISKNNNGSAAVAFIKYTNMASMLSPNLFNATSNTVKTMMSTVVSATLPKTSNTQLTEPVNFTLKHIAELQPDGVLSCVYWNETEWVIDECNITYTDRNYTTCTCAHLSTYAIIMQSKPVQRNQFGAAELLSLIAVAVGLVFLSLALLTIAFCLRGSRLTNTALINLCVSLLLAHLLFLITQNLIQHIKPHKLLCAVLAGVLHFLFLSAFVWMFIEAVLLFISVKNLTKIRSKQKEILGWKCLIVIGYIIPLVVVGVSVGLFPEGYGSEQCWLKTDKNFIWSFLAPVCVILVANLFLFIVIIIMLKYALASLKCEVSQFRETRILVFKTLLQFIILGCTWSLGLFTDRSNVLEIVFVFLNSQQGTFIFLVHCVLNEEVRQHYRKWLGVVCSCCKSITPTATKKK